MLEYPFPCLHFRAAGRRKVGGTERAAAWLDLIDGGGGFVDAARYGLNPLLDVRVDGQVLGCAEDTEHPDERDDHRHGARP